MFKVAKSHNETKDPSQEEYKIKSKSIRLKMSLRQRLKMQQQVGAFKFSWRSWSHSTALWLLLINISLLALICHPDVTLTSQAATTLSQSVDEIKIVLSSVKPHSSASTSSQQRAQSRSDHDDSHAPPFSEQSMAVRRDFAVELLKMLHEQHGRKKSDSSRSSDVMENRQSPGQLGFGPQMMNQLLEALGADGDMRRLIDWVRNSFNLASIPELTTQFVVGKLGSVNCPALLKPDKEESLVPRFLLFNEHYTDVPFELSINPDANECITNGKFDPRRKTVVLVHGYLAGYTLLDGITNIKNRLLDLNRQANDKAMGSFMSQSSSANFVYTEDLNQKIRQQLYNVVIVDWFNGANPTPRANYIRAAVNAQVVGRLMARFLSSLVVQCGTPSSNIQIIAHSLGE